MAYKLQTEPSFYQIIHQNFPLNLLIKKPACRGNHGIDHRADSGFRILVIDSFVFANLTGRYGSPYPFHAKCTGRFIGKKVFGPVFVAVRIGTGAGGETGFSFFIDDLHNRHPIYGRWAGKFQANGVANRRPTRRFWLTGSIVQHKIGGEAGEIRPPVDVKSFSLAPEKARKADCSSG